MEQTVERIKKQTVMYARNTLAGGFYQIDAEDFQEDIYQNILLYMKDRGLEESESNLKSADQLAETVADYYKSGVEFPYLSIFASLCNTISNYTKYALVGGSVLAVILVILLFMLCRRKYHGAKFIVYAILSAMLNVLVPVGYLYFSRVYTRITIDTGFIKYFITKFCDTCIHRLAFVCLFFIPVIIGLIIWDAIAHKRAVKKDMRHSSHRRRKTEA